MAYSSIIVTQGGVPGAAGVSRDDIDLFSVASQSVTFSNDTDGDVGVQTWEWTLVERPYGSVAALVGPTNASCTLNTDIYGRYVVALRVNGLGDSTNGYSETVCGCRYVSPGTIIGGTEEYLDWLPPAANEGWLANWSANDKGAQPEIWRLFNHLRTYALPAACVPSQVVSQVHMDAYLAGHNTTSTNNGAFQVAGHMIGLNMALLPWVKEAVFQALFTRNGGADTAEVRLYDVTNAVAVTSALLTDASGAMVELSSAALTIGSAAGNLRNDALTRYRVEIRSNPGGGASLTELEHARLAFRMAT
jgi:hypothetical protein